MQNIHLYDEQRHEIMLGIGQIKAVPKSEHEDTPSVQGLLQNVQKWAVEVGLISDDEQVDCWI